MFEIPLGGTSRNCQVVSRRNVLKVGALTAGGLTLADALRANAAGGSLPGAKPKKSVICFWLDGGPTHMETWDPKPDAPSDYKGPLNAISTAVPGVFINELFPRTAQLMDKVSVVRSVHHNNGDHFAAAHWMWTGYHGSSAARREAMYPSIGSIVSKVHGANRRGIPAFVSVPYAMTVGRKPGYQGSAFLGIGYKPFDAGSDPNSRNFQVRNVSLPTGIDKSRAAERRTLLSSFDRVRREIDHTGLMDGIDQFNQQAFEMVTGREASRAFDIHKEDPKLRDLYGRNSIGQGALLARRLVESGVTFVTVHSGGWDNHSGIENAMKRHSSNLDPALSSLISDLDQRGMLDDVMVLVMGEFGRTPKVNAGAGRDHWGNVMSVLMGGGGLNGGVIVGASDKNGARPARRAVKPAHILHTVYKQLGIDPSINHIDRAGRPIPILSEGEPLSELI